MAVFELQKRQFSWGRPPQPGAAEDVCRNGRFHRPDLGSDDPDLSRTAGVPQRQWMPNLFNRERVAQALPPHLQLGHPSNSKMSETTFFAANNDVDNTYGQRALLWQPIASVKPAQLSPRAQVLAFESPLFLNVAAERG